MEHLDTPSKIGLVVLVIGIVGFSILFFINSQSPVVHNKTQETTQETIQPVKENEQVINEILTIQNITYSEDIPPGNYVINVTTFVPEASGIVAVSYRGNPTIDKFGNEVYGYTETILGKSDRYSDLNTTFVIPEGARDSHLVVILQGGSVHIQVFKIV
jgi:hypothetical protein